jgi:K+-transporting ATPase ATPase A chain
MTALQILQSAFIWALIWIPARLLGGYMARVYEGNLNIPVLGALERWLYRLSRVRPDEDMPFSTYAGAVLLSNVFGAIAVYVILRIQGSLPLNPAGFGAVSPHVALNTAVSFATNTNWQAYGGETTLSQLTQMLGLAVQNFLSAATGMAVLVALIRGFTRRNAAGIGNFWVDLTRSILYVLLPLSMILSVMLVSRGVVQTFTAAESALLIDPITTDTGVVVDRQTIALGPVASQVAIKQLGTNGGGYFNVNSAHPFENPDAWSNLLEVISILLIPVALCFTFGAMVKDKRQGWVLLAAMTFLFVPLLWLTVWAEQRGNPELARLGVDMANSALQSGGNMEGKEVRFGIFDSAFWAVSTTAASNGSVNAMHDSFTPLGGLAPMWLMQLGEVIFGGVGSGLYGMLMYAIVAVFIAGLMVGRTPEYLGKKIEAREMKMASLVILLPSATVLLGTALACVLPAGTEALGNPGAHGFSEILYAFSSGANNNGSAFGGLTVNGPFYASAMTLSMLIGRYWVMIPVLAIAGSLARKRAVPPSVGTLPTHTPIFFGLLVATVVLIGALTFMPALALGPLVEHLLMSAR